MNVYLNELMQSIMIRMLDNEIQFQEQQIEYESDNPIWIREREEIIKECNKLRSTILRKEFEQQDDEDF